MLHDRSDPPIIILHSTHINHWQILPKWFLMLIRNEAREEVYGRHLYLRFPALLLVAFTFSLTLTPLLLELFSTFLIALYSDPFILFQ
jgi:hypothetical protein